MSHLVRNNSGTKAARLILFVPLALMMLAASPARSQTITTFAGNGGVGYSGDGGPATLATLNYPRGLAFDSAGMLYIADVNNYRVRKVTPAGIISTVAGSGVYGNSGDGGPATLAQFSNPMGVAVDAGGNLYIADSTNVRIRKVTPGGIVATVAGTGVQGFSGDGGPATAATLNSPTSLIVDSAGNIYFADSSNQRIRRVGADGKITTIAGNGLDGFSGDGGLAISASMSFPLGLVKDPSGNVYFTDGNNNRVRMITPAGIISTFAGGGTGNFGGDGGLATAASLNIPSDLAFDAAGNLYIADAGNNRVRKVNTSGIITTVAGTANNGYSGDGGPATQALLNHPWGLTTDAAGVVYVADRVNSRIRAISAPLSGPPTLLVGGAVNGASFAGNFAVAPGAIVAIFGSNLADVAGGAAGVPLPNSIGVTSVTFNGIAAPLYYVSQGQINAQAPFELGTGAVSLQVTRGAAVSQAITVNVANVSPGIFILNQAANQGAIVHAADYSLVNSGNPARTGESLAIFCNGLGPVSVPVKSGAPSPGIPLAYASVAPTVTLGGLNANVSFAGLTPGLVGLYQINVTVPGGLQAGNLGLQVSTGGLLSNIATVAVMP